jgi:hypothetical protein
MLKYVTCAIHLFVITFQTNCWADFGIYVFEAQVCAEVVYCISSAPLM